MARKRALGRGLEALIPAGPEIRPGILELSIDHIRPNPRQPRSAFSEASLQELADSIRQHGVLQPLLVTTSGEDYQLVAGQRRLQAARLAGLTVVPAVVREAGEQSSLELALVENLQRSDLNPLEAAEGFRQLVEDFGLSHEQVGARVGKSRSHVSNTLRLLRLSAAVRKGLAAAEISESHARALLGISRAQDQVNAMRTIISRGLNVRQSEALVRQLNSGPRRRTKAARQSPEVSDLQDRLESALGTKVRIRGGQRAGRVEIHYYSVEELNAIADQLLGVDE